MTETPVITGGHYLPDKDWGEVVRVAAQVREEILANAQGGAASGITPVYDMTVAGRASRKYFPVSGIPTQLLVLHSGECPLKGGYARSLSLWVVATIYPGSPIASWTWFQDPLEMVALIPPELGAWHASEANTISEGFEQAGYARLTRAEWLTPDGRTQMESLAYFMAMRALANGIPARWLTTAEVNRATAGDRSIKGLCFHRQIDPETRTDPGNGYPADLLLERIQFYMGTGSLQPAGNITDGEIDMVVTPREVAEAVLGYKFKLSDGSETNMLTQLQNQDKNQVAQLRQQLATQSYLEAMNAKDDRRDQALAAMPDAILDQEITMPDGRVTTPRAEFAWMPENFAALQRQALGADDDKEN